MSKNTTTDNQDTSGFDVSRRDILRGATVATAVAAGAGGLAPPAAANTALGESLAQDPISRAQDAAQLRRRRANVNRNEAPGTPQAVNDDEVRLPDFIGNFSKTLKHNARGEVTQASYLSFTTALASRQDSDFEAILVGRENDPLRQRLVSPQGAYAFELSGLDGNANRINPAPAFDGDVTEAEMAELYGYSVTRDVPFIEYDTNNKIQRVVDSLNTFPAIADAVPTDNGVVTPQNFGRGGLPTMGIRAPGTEVGPLVSQFLLKNFVIGQLNVEQRYPRLERGGANQFMTQFPEWLAIQRGFAPNARAPGGNASVFTDRVRFISKMRDLSEWVHRDFPLQSPLHALSVIFGFGTDEAFDPALPYNRVNSATQEGFVTFGLPDISHLTVHAPRQSLTGAWYQKWLNHRRARPEVYGGRLNVQARGERDYGLGARLIDSRVYRMAANESRRVNGVTDNTDISANGLLPMAFPEGSPSHPAYPGGHSSFVAAGSTVLKAFVNEDFVIPAPVQANRNGTELIPWGGEALTIGGELNKLVANVTHARDAAGMHWRSDGEGNLIGEAVGIALLRDYSVTYNEEFDGLTLRKFNGQRILIRNGNVTEIGG
ncbi:MAG: phosphoesterase [Pseudomonadota bacterium]